MTRTPTRLFVTPLVLIALIALSPTAPARAGQVRVDVSDLSTTQQFFPYVVNVNLGDQVVWVWKGGGHTVLNWSLPADSVNLDFDGTIFDTDPTHFAGNGSSTRFSWKSDRVGLVPYVCLPHIPDMGGRIYVTNPAVSPKLDVADFRLSEVQYNIAAGEDLIEITNYGTATGNLARYRLAISTTISFELTGPPGAAVNDIIVPSGGRVVVHLNTAGTNTDSDVYFTTFNPPLGLSNTNGSLALYVPNTVTTGTPAGNALSNADMLIDFVQWGAGAQANEATAVSAGFWGSATFVPRVAATHSLEYCPDGAIGHGVARWAEVSTPNFGSDGQCLTPTLSETWGQLKTIYR